MKRTCAGAPGCAAVLIVLVAFAAEAGAATDEVGDLLARPLSPGVVGLLVEHTGDERARARLAEALKDPRPAVRASAARVVNVMTTRSLLPSVVAAVAAETDAAVLEEQALALVALGEGAHDEALLAAARRDPVRFAPVVALAFARVRGRTALAQRSLRELLPDDAVWRFVDLATRGDAAAVAEAGSAALRDGDAAMWRAVLAVARDHVLPLDDALLVTALGSPTPALRADTLWHLVRAEIEPSAGLRPALDASPEATGQSPHAGGLLAFEMVQRRLGRRPQERPEWIASLRAPGPEGAPRDLTQHPDALRRLTGAELSAFSEYTRGDAGALAKDLRRQRAEPPRPGPDRAAARGGAERSELRLPGGYPAGLVPEVFQLSGCTLRGQEVFYGGRVSYGPDGRPREVSRLRPDAIPPECVRAVKVLLFLALAPPARLKPAGHADMLIVPLVDEVLACLGEAEPPPVASAGTVRVGGRIEEPKKLHHVNPWYPPGARDARVEGPVVLEATLGVSGCVRSVEVIQTRHPMLDLVSLVTVGQGRYTPTRLNGVAVPVIMTVTVNFRLR